MHENEHDCETNKPVNWFELSEANNQTTSWNVQ